MQRVPRGLRGPDTEGPAHRPHREVTGKPASSGRPTAGEGQAVQVTASEARGPTPDLGCWLWTLWWPECGGQDSDSGADTWVRAPLPPDQRGPPASCVVPDEAQSLGAKWRQQVASDPVGLQPGSAV